MHQGHTQLFHTTDCLNPKDIRAFLQGQPSRAGNQPVQDVAVHAVACQRDGLVSGFRGNRNDIAGQNIAFDLQILAVSSPSLVIENRLLLEYTPKGNGASLSGKGK